MRRGGFQGIASGALECGDPKVVVRGRRNSRVGNLGEVGIGAIWSDMQDSLAATVVKHLASMAATQLIAARVTHETKAHFRALADRQQLTESGLLKRLISLTIQSVGGLGSNALKPNRRKAMGSRVCIRLRAEDQLLLQERASKRQMAAATYAGVLVRAHLRSLPPLPRQELMELKRSVAELGAIGRNINQIARAANQGGRVVAPGRDDLRSIIRVCEGLRDHVKALIKSNTRSWESGHAEAND
jgi:Bacterial mobilisation protein (MobC)